jgi:DNA mismatch repair ATPase MutS
LNQKPRAKKCLECKETFQPMNSLVKCCSIHCAIAHGKKEAPKQKMKENRQAKKEFNASDRQKLTKDAQTAFNTYIRTRDGKKCISCLYEGEGRQFHCGHYKSQGGNSALRFNELNCSSQCSICNNHLSGNLANYRMNLIKKIGEDAVIELETTKNTKRYSIDELKEIVSTYKTKLKEIINANV